MDIKTRTTYMLSTRNTLQKKKEKEKEKETHFRPTDTYRLKVRGWKKKVYTNGNHKKAGVAIPVSDKIDYKIKNVTRDKEDTT